MEIIIHQAIFGEKNGAHSFLQSTLNNNDLFENVSRHTDLSSYPPYGIKWQAFISSFCFQNYYILMKTYPDEKTDRRAMVFSHILLINKNDLDNINNLRLLIDIFPLDFDKNIKLDILKFDSDLFIKNNSFNDNRINKVINGLVNNKLIIWDGYNNFEEMISYIWNNLWGNARSSFLFTFSFIPDNIQDKNYNIICSLNSSERWKEAIIVKELDDFNLSTEVEFYLKGEYEKSKNFEDLINKLEKLPNIKHLYLLDRFIKLQKDKTDTSIITKVRIISIISKDINKELDLKNSILKEFIDAINNFSLKNIISIKNITIESFNGYEKHISDSIGIWCQNNIFSIERNKENNFTELIKYCFSDNEYNWWKEPIKNSLSEKIRYWKKEYAQIIWIWITKDIGVLNFIDKVIDTHIIIEKDLISYYPNYLDKEYKLKIIEFVKNKKWLLFHSIIVSDYYNSIESYEKQLEIDTDLSFCDGLLEISKRVSKKHTIEATIKYEDTRLIKISSDICLNDVSNLNYFDISNHIGREIWFLVLKKDCSYVFKNISNPHETVFKLLDMIIYENTTIEDDILINIGNTNHANLIDYKNRSLIWDKLCYRAKNNFLKKTIDGFFVRYFSNKISISFSQN